MPHSSTLPVGFERRREDYGLITGHSRYVDDLKPAGRPAPLHMVVVRSPYAHAIIKEIRVDAARELPGVVAAFASRVTLPLSPRLPRQHSTYPALRLKSR
ncbi:MAG: hypothetical protein E6I91_10940 [Chloroflexi bacterium]|nr:MAG: hypothetical protein E6I91_10940 [Chloroflexota bacterium]